MTKRRWTRRRAGTNQMLLRRYSDAARRARELKMLLDVSRAITSTLELQEILDDSAETLTNLIQASNAFILLVDLESRQLRGGGCSNPKWREAFRQDRSQLSERSLAIRAMRSKEPILVPDIGAMDERSLDRPDLDEDKSVLGVPLIVRDEPIGCILISDAKAPRIWTPAEIERVSLIANQIAIAISNARLYDDLLRSYSQLGKAQLELVKRERLAALGEMAAVVAHEVRNPLGVIFNSLGSLDKLLQPDGDAKLLLEIIGEEAERLDRIVQDLLEFARPHVPSLEPRQLEPLLEETLYAARAHAATHPDIELVLDFQPMLGPVSIDDRMLRQALLNIFVNAMQSMPKRGELTVRTSSERVEGRSFAKVEVIDRGSGIPPEFAERIFQPFFTTKATGTGLGLAVVKRVVEAHNGSIHFESSPGEGTTFSLLLPLEETHG